ncbi:aldo/keto reductase [Halomarina oriensis]|uniref:Aldo/keto reductase n=1 Tax=Halomarina oriensis TaxID=671145 RepID=A0A6B0GJZ0_9EURY|nr:aldo/keto reductase [Halomarina oriensis]MWG34147.1 aldo/keto reductase [Halomarina oriensis]
MDLPPVGLGTMAVDDSAVVETALDVGYRHLDTARIYDNEAVVGAGLAASDVSRESVTVATKLWVDDLAATDVRAATEESAARLGVDTVDLLYVHRPRGPYEPTETLPALDTLVDDGLVDHVGASNFTVDQLRTARDHLDAPLAAHQVERHPLFVRDDLLADAREHGYPLVAYSPLAGGQVRDLPELQAVADRHDTTPEAVAIAWLTGTTGVVTVPKASSRAHLEANLAAATLELDDDDRASVESVETERELFPE